MKVRKLAVWVGTIGLGVLISQKGLAREKITIEKISSRSVAVSHAYARTGGENLLVAGQVSRWHELHLQGHVDVEVYHPDGNLMATDQIQLPGIMSQRKGRLELPFAGRFDFVPPKGSLIKVRYHAVPASLAENGEAVSPH